MDLFAALSEASTQPRVEPRGSVRHSSGNVVHLAVGDVTKGTFRSVCGKTSKLTVARGGDITVWWSQTTCIACLLG